MNTAKNLRKALLTVLLAMTISSADAHRKVVRHRVPHSKTIVVKPVVIKKADCYTSRNARLAAVWAYLDNHKSITIRKYAKLTGLSRGVAEAELDAFSRDRNTHIVALVSGNKKVYVKR